MKKQILKYSLAFSIMLYAFLSWFSVDRAINVPGSSTWLIPMMCFSLFFIALSLGVLIIKEKFLLHIILGVSFLFSLIFAFSIGHIIILLFSCLLVYLAMERISNELKENIKLNIAKSMRTGRILTVLALALSITSQYTSEVINSEKANVLPKLNFNFTISKVIPIIYPDLKDSNGNVFTVDNFILEVAQKKSGGILGGILNSQELAEGDVSIDKNKAEQIILNNQEKILKDGRASFGKLSGKDLTGQEKIADVFSEIINNQISKYFSPNLEKSDFPLATFFMSFFLILTIISIGPFMAIIAGYVAIFIFWLFKKTKLVIVSSVMKEVEVIE